jgi:hypothetical protein
LRSKKAWGIGQIDKFIQELKAEHQDVRTKAVESLINVGLSAVDAVILTLQDENFNARKGAAEILGQIGGFVRFCPAGQGAGGLSDFRH